MESLGIGLLLLLSSGLCFSPVCRRNDAQGGGLSVAWSTGRCGAAHSGGHLRRPSRKHQTRLQGPLASAAQFTYDQQKWARGFDSLVEEQEYDITDCVGTLPPELHGTLFRNGPGKMRIGGEPVMHQFDGDGMITAFRFKDGRASFRNRYVRTEGFVAETAANKILFRNTFGTQRGGGWQANMLDLEQKNVANTNVLWWGGQLHALWEAGQPYQLDPADLTTLGVDDFGGLFDPGFPVSFESPPLDSLVRRSGALQMGHVLAAHPKVLGDRLLNFGTEIVVGSDGSRNGKLLMYEWDEDYRLVRRQEKQVEGLCFIHDFAATENYFVFTQNPVELDPLPFILGLKGAGECLVFDPSRPTVVHLIPRDPQAGFDYHRIETEACFVFHHANAHETDSGQVLLDSVVLDRLPSFEQTSKFDSWEAFVRALDFDSQESAQLHRFTLHLHNDSASDCRIATRSVEFPRINEDHMGLPTQYTYSVAVNHPSRNGPFQTIAKWDMQAEALVDAWVPPPHYFAGGAEPVFVPRDQGAQQAEDNGWLLAVMYNSELHRSEVCLLDARNLAAGPVWTGRLKHHVPFGLHGNWASGVVF